MILFNEQQAAVLLIGLYVLPWMYICLYAGSCRKSHLGERKQDIDVRNI